MVVVIACIHDDHVNIGFNGDSQPQYTIPLPSLDSLILHKVFLESFRALLVSAHSVSAIIVEPPLFPIKSKKKIVEILLIKLRVHSVGFIQRSVCCITSAFSSVPDTARGAGIMIDESEQLVVPVYDYRELTPFIRTSAEWGMDKTIAMVIKSVAIDVRKVLKTNVFVSSNKDAFEDHVWQGASALMSFRKAWPLLTREQMKHGVRVWDSLYDMK